MFLQVCVCPQGGRVSASVHAGMPYPPGTRQTPPQDQADTPQDQADTPQDQAETPPDQADTPPGPGRHPPNQADPPGKQTPAYGLRAAGTHPTGMHSCFTLYLGPLLSLLKICPVLRKK